MSTAVLVNTYTYAVGYVTDKMLLSLKELIRESGLSPAKLSADWAVLHRGIKRWIESGHLERIILEVFNPATGTLVSRWDFVIYYGYHGDGSMWVDTEDIKYHIRKAGLWPSDCEYEVLTKTKPGRPDVEGWTSTSFRSTEGFEWQAIGTTLDAKGLDTRAGYWRKT